MIDPISEDVIASYEDRLMNAMKNSDVNALDKLLHNDLVFIGSDGTTVTKEMDIEAYRSGQIKISDMMATDRNIRLVDDLGIVTVSVDVRGERMGETIQSKERFLRVWEHGDGGRWGLVTGAMFLYNITILL